MKALVGVAISLFALASSTLLPTPGEARPRAAELRPRARETPASIEDTLVALEKNSWKAWQGRDGAFFQHFLSDDHVEVGFGGPTGKVTVVAGVNSHSCVVKSYAVSHFALTQFDANTALLTYHAEQSTECGGHAVPSPVWVSSLYLKRQGRWENAAYQQTTTGH